MIGAPCRREEELFGALARGFVGDELATHVAGCPACSEIRTVAGALLDERAEAMAEARVPSAGTMWWRLRIRRRQEDEARARRWLLVGQAATLAIALALFVSFFGPQLAHGLRGLADTIRLSTPLVIALGTLVLIAPLAGWIAIRKT